MGCLGTATVMQMHKVPIPVLGLDSDPIARWLGMAVGVTCWEVGQACTGAGPQPLLLQGSFPKQGLLISWGPVACPGKVTVAGRVTVVGLTQRHLHKNFLCWGSPCGCNSQ